MGPDGLAEFDQLTRDEELIGERAEAPVAEAVRESLAALEWTELSWPRDPSRSYAEHRLLVKTRLSGLETDEEEVEGFPDGVRRSCATSSWRTTRARPSSARPSCSWTTAAATCTTRCAGAPRTSSTSCSTGRRARSSWTRPTGRRSPRLLERWVVFALTRAGVEQRWQEPVVAAVRECADAFLDTDDDSPSRPLVDHLLASGVDLQDPAAVQAAVGAYNAQVLAERARQ